MTEPDNATPHRASDYDQVIRRIIPFYDAIQTESLDLVKSVKPDVKYWLDTGCGTGYLIEMALRLFPQTQFILTDPSEAMLKEAKKRFKNEPSERVRIISAMGSENLISGGLEVKPQVITAILCHHYLSASGRRRAVQSCYETLEDGGLFITFENIDNGILRANEIALDRWGNYQIKQGSSVSAVESHRKRFKTRYFPITIDEHLDQLRATGLQIAQIFWLSYMQAGFFALK
jgi:tRNA (cmo5U34)-methyltransferase